MSTFSYISSTFLLTPSIVGVGCWMRSAADLIHGYNKELFEDLNATERLSVVKAQFGNKRDDSPITVSEVTKVVKKRLLIIWEGAQWSCYSSMWKGAS